MRSFGFTALVAMAIAIAPAGAAAETYFGFKTGTGNAPAAPAVTLPLSPHFEVVPRGHIIVPVEEPKNVDLFRYEGYWYAYAGGYWYRSRKARETYSVIEVHNVPKMVLFVPMKHWQHHPEDNFDKMRLQPGVPEKALASGR